MYAIQNLLLFWNAGASIVFPAPSFSSATTLDAIDREQVTHMYAVPSLVVSLIGHPSFDKAKMRSLQLIGLAGTVISREIIATIKERFGVGVCVEFGMSEAPHLLCLHPHESLSLPDEYASVGRATAGAKIKICDPETRKVLSKNEVGELHVCGGVVIKEYLYGNNEVF